MKLFTIGYGNRKPAELLKILRDNGIRTVIDVRRRGSKAYMRLYWAEQPTGENRFCNWLYVNGIRHIQPAIFGNYYDSLEEYKKSLSLPDKVRNIRILAEGIERGNIDNYCLFANFCLLCAEIDPAKCHRSILAEELVKRLGNDWEVVNL